MNNIYDDKDFNEQEVLSEDEIKERQDRKRAKGHYYDYNKNDYNYRNGFNDDKYGRSNKGLTSLILGAVSLLCIFLGQLSFIGSIIAIVGLIMGVDAKNKGDTAYAKTGIILNTISLCSTLLVTVACIACLSCIGCSLMNSMW